MRVPSHPGACVVNTFVELRCGDLGCSGGFPLGSGTSHYTPHHPSSAQHGALTIHAQGCDGTCIQPMNTIWIHLPLQCSPNQLNPLRVRGLAGPIHLRGKSRDSWQELQPKWLRNGWSKQYVCGCVPDSGKNILHESRLDAAHWADIYKDN